MEDEKQFEMAQQLENSMVESGRLAIAKAIPVQPANFDGCCVDCGEDIPELRVKTGAITCLLCQQKRELRKRFSK